MVVVVVVVDDDDDDDDDDIHGFSIITVLAPVITSQGG